jgi:hypothetical protein
MALKKLGAEDKIRMCNIPALVSLVKMSDMWSEGHSCHT